MKINIWTCGDVNHQPAMTGWGEGRKSQPLTKADILWKYVVGFGKIKKLHMNVTRAVALFRIAIKHPPRPVAYSRTQGHYDSAINFKSTNRPVH